MSAALRVVPPGQPPLAPSTAAELSERIRQLQAEARSLAREHIDALAVSLLQTQRLADEIANGGEAYPPGVRDVARRLGEDTAAKASTLEGIIARL